MTFRAAIKSGKPIRLNKCFYYANSYLYGHSNTTTILPNTWIDAEWFLSTVFLTKEHILSNKWEIKKK